MNAEDFVVGGGLGQLAEERVVGAGFGERLLRRAPPPDHGDLVGDAQDDDPLAGVPFLWRIARRMPPR